MKLLDKIKNAIFEEDEFEESDLKKEQKEEVKPVFHDEIVKKIDIEKTIPKAIEQIKEERPVEKRVMPKREHRVTPVIFDEEDFIMEDKIFDIPKKKEQPKPKKEEVKKPLYSGYKDDKPKEKFKPSPIISPVYGFVGVSPVLEQPRNEEISSFNEMFAKEKKEVITLDSVRQKAYGNKVEEEDDDDLGLLYDMKQEETPAISKLTIGDAEEYFDDLGLEYNVDYKDSAREKNKASTRSDKNKELSDAISLEEEIKPMPKVEEKIIESTQELEITKEQLKPKTAKEIKKVTKIKDLEIEDDDVEEKNLYDLIDMMYEAKE